MVFPTLSNSTVRELLVSVLSDPNLWIADEAFRQIELFDFFHRAQPDECIVIFPPLRKSVRLPARELEGVTSSGTLACTRASQLGLTVISFSIPIAQCQSRDAW